MNFHSLLCVVILLLLFVIKCSGQADYEDEDGRPSSWARCPWIRNKLKNGRVKVRSRGRIAKFLCNPGYEMVGKRFATCVRGEWNNPIPFCVARGCYKLPEPVNGKVTEMYRGALLVYDCLPGYSLQGPVSLYCDGTRWSDAAPICEVSIEQPEASCDFEDPDLCGWSHDPTHDFEWRRNQFGTPSGHVGTGPSYDHTFGKGKAGFYLYLEASSPRKEKDTCRLFSPVFSANYSPGCFTFWYHMYGATTGELRIYVKPESHLFGELSPTWEKSGDQGNQWLRGEIDIPDYLEKFQIIIEGVRGSSYVGDTAIDDVSLWSSNCSAVRILNDTLTEAAAESCRGRCKEPDNTDLCECTESCVVNNTCCLDYAKICTTGTESSSWDGETPPSFIVTDYLNAGTQSPSPYSESSSTTMLHEVTAPEFLTTETSPLTKESQEIASPVILSVPSKTTNSPTTSTRLTTYTTATPKSQSTVQLTPLSERTKALSYTGEIRTTSAIPKTSASITTPRQRKIFILPPAPQTTTTTAATGTIKTMPTATASTTTDTRTTTRPTTLLLISSSPIISTASIPSVFYTTTSSTLNYTLTSQATSSSSKLTSEASLTTTAIRKITQRFPTFPESKSTDKPFSAFTGSQEILTTLSATQTAKPEARYTARYPPWMMNTASAVPHTTAKSSNSIQITSPFFTISPKPTSTSPPPLVIRTMTTRSTTTVSTPFPTLRLENVRTVTATRTVTQSTAYERKMKVHPTYKYTEETDKDLDISPESSASKSTSNSTNPAVATVTICFLLFAAAGCGTAYYCYRNRTRRLSKQTEDSEIRFLSDNEVLEFSEGSEKMS